MTKHTRPEADISIEGKNHWKKKIQKKKKNLLKLLRTANNSPKAVLQVTSIPVEEADVSIEGKALEEKDLRKNPEENLQNSENGEQSNLSTMQKQPTRLQKIEKNILRSTKYFVVAFFVEFLFIVLALLPVGNRDCCITAKKMSRL